MATSCSSLDELASLRLCVCVLDDEALSWVVIIFYVVWL